MARLALGALAAAALSLVARAVWGREAAVAAVTLAGVATLFHWLAARMTGRIAPGAGVERPVLYGLGMLVRGLGVVVFAAAVTLDSERFPPLPAALGYLGTALPLLYMETRPRR